MRHQDGSAGDADYGRIGQSYSTYRQPDPRIAAMIADALGPARTVLNVGAGAGSYEPLDREVTAVEPSASMRAQRPAHLSPAVDATAERLPFADDSFDAVTISYGLRNVHDTRAGLAELLRVTRPGGRILVCEFSTPTWTPFRIAYRWYMHHVMPRFRVVSSNAPAYDYLVESILAWPDQRSLAELMTEVGWRDVQWKNLTGGIVAMHRGWVK